MSKGVCLSDNMKEDADKNKEADYISNDNGNHVSSTQTPASPRQSLKLIAKEKGMEGEYRYQLNAKGKAAAITTMTTSDAVITPHKQLANDDVGGDKAQQQHEENQLLSLTAAAVSSSNEPTTSNNEECSRTTEAGIVNGTITPSLPLLCAQTSATSLRNQNEKVAEKVVGANFLVGNNLVQETHETNCDTVSSSANSKEPKSSVLLLSPSQSSEKTAFDSSSSTSSGNWPHVNGVLNMTIKSGIKGDEISSSIEDTLTQASSQDCNSDDNSSSTASSPISDNGLSNTVSENEVTTTPNGTSNGIPSNITSKDTSPNMMSTKPSLSSSDSSLTDFNKDNDLSILDRRLLCKHKANHDDGITGSGGEMEEDEDEELQDGETPINLSPALDPKMVTDVIDNNMKATNNHNMKNRQHLDNTNNSNGNSVEGQVEAINLCKNNDSINKTSRAVSSSPPQIAINSSSIGLSAKMRLKKQRLAMEAASTAGSSSSLSSESGRLTQNLKCVRPESPSAVTNSIFQHQQSVIASSSTNSKYNDPTNEPQSMDIVMNLSSKPTNDNAINEARRASSLTTNYRESIYNRWENKHPTSNNANDVDSSALHRLAEAAEWKQVRV